MNRHTSSGFRPVTSLTVREAAEIFAARAARKAYGRRGYARTLNCSAWSQDGTVHEYEAFVGYRSGPNEATGHGIRFTVLSRFE